MGSCEYEGRRVVSTVERARFAALYEEHFDGVFGFLCRRVGRVEGEDLTAQVFSAALRDRHAYDPERGSARVWLFGIAAHALRGHRRREERQLRAFARSGTDPLLTESDEVEDRLDAKRAARTLAGALSALSSGDRDVLLLAAWAGLTSEEIGEALAIPAGTARSRLNRARRKLRTALHASGHAHSPTIQEALDG
jgi:RNA polymerase sigma factor (sigma-70 family)